MPSPACPPPTLDAIRAALCREEDELLRGLRARVPDAIRVEAVATGRRLVTGARARSRERPYLDAFLQEFGLSNPEGVALMCLAEALLRVPDDATVDRLIAEKLAGRGWSEHAGGSASLFVNASTWGLMLTGQIVQLPDELQRDPATWLGALARRAGEPLVRQAMKRAMRIMGGEFVVGHTIEAALARSHGDPALALCSFDMLGEGARTDADADRYLESYHQAIVAIAAATARAPAADPYAASSLSIKLSALDPRYTALQRQRVRARLIPRVVEFVRSAASRGLAITIDAEEADRLELSLQVIETLARDTATRDWPGLGFAVQAYGKRAPAVLDWALALARATGRRLGIRLVKGAYWDSEIKRAQERGLPRFPVYTRKVSTDVSYLACAARLFAAADWIHAAFATHNAHTIGAVLALARPGAAWEFQRLHGMGTLLYDEARRVIPELPPVRVYAPVGPHESLLAYLVRRLLENGANTSFVNRCMDDDVAVERVVVDPLAELDALESVAHPAIAPAPRLYGGARRNSQGVDWGRLDVIDDLAGAVASSAANPRVTRPARAAAVLRVVNPADHDDVVGEIPASSRADVARAFERATQAFPDWNAAGAAERAACLERAADTLEDRRDEFLALLVREAGKTLPDAVAEVREAADFCRYYAAEAKRLFATPVPLAGPTGEQNELSLTGRGPIACISPWNFPLAIFTGQVTAALAAGNTVLAKPAEATPLVAQAMVEVLHAAGIPADALSLLPMLGRDFGESALDDPRLGGVVFTGSTRTGQWLNRRLAAREGAILPLIAETGGLNAMVVDSTALIEQVVDDALVSAFGSAGQRCSALRLLFLQDDIADAALEMLAGAMDALVMGDPRDPATDLGPVISSAAVTALDEHVEQLARTARLIRRVRLEPRHARGSFVAPALIELQDPRQLTSEQFGPILHVVRYRSTAIDGVLESIRQSGYGLTLGIHTRLEGAWRRIHAATCVGNTYVNRNMIGAVVGVQPFGGSGLSGTGPKAGGPGYLPRLAHERSLSVNTTASGGNVALMRLG